MMVSVLSSLNDFVRIEVLFVLVDSLLRSVVPACIDPFLALVVLPGAVDLGSDGFRDIVRVLYVNPIANFPELAIVQDTVRQG